MNNTQTFHRTIARLTFLYAEQEKRKELVRQELTGRFFRFIQNFRSLYDTTINGLYAKYVEPFKQRHRDLFDLSLLEAIEKAHWETYHSKLLAYIWGRDRHAFVAFLNSIAGIDPALIAQVKESVSYCIKTEQKTSAGKFIDLFITDDRNWVIAIENKIDAKVSTHETGELQITHYRKWVTKEFIGFNRCFILLSHKNNTKYLINEKEWKHCNYSILFKSLLSIVHPDRIMREYQSAVLSLLCDKDASVDDVSMSLYGINQFRIFEDE